MPRHFLMKWRKSCQEITSSPTLPSPTLPCSPSASEDTPTRVSPTIAASFYHAHNEEALDLRISKAITDLTPPPSPSHDSLPKPTTKVTPEAMKSASRMPHPVSPETIATLARLLVGAPLYMKSAVSPILTSVVKREPLTTAIKCSRKRHAPDARHNEASAEKRRVKLELTLNNNNNNNNDNGDIDPAMNVVQRTPEAERELAAIQNLIGEFRCALCRIRYVDAFDLAKHCCSCIRSVEFPCPECAKVFKYAAHLASHRRWHKPRPSPPVATPATQTIIACET